MINFDVATKENIEEHNPNWRQISDHPYRILIIRGSGSGKTNALFNLISNQRNIDKICLYVKDLYEEKYKLLIKKRRNTDLKYCKNSKAFIGYSNDMVDIYKNIEEYDLGKEHMTLINNDCSCA